MTTSTRAAVSVLIGADLGKTFRDSFTTANKQLSALGDAIKKVNERISQIDSFRKSSRATKEASLAYQEAKQKLNLLGAEISKTNKPSKELENNFRRARIGADKAKSAFMESARATRDMGKALLAAGVNFKTFNQQQEKFNQTLITLKNRQTTLQNISDAKAANLSARAHYRSQMFDGVAIGSTLYAMIKPAVNFEFAMARLGAVTEERKGSANFVKLSDKAKELGRTTQYTSEEAAKAMQFLGMAGFNTNQILSATPAILNLAIAEDMEMAEAAETVANILNSFAMKAERATEATDVLVKASIASTTDVRRLGETMKYVAPAAAAVGGSLQETVALASALNGAGIQASMAGTMLRSAYLRLAVPAKAGAEALGKKRDEMKITAEEMPDAYKEAILAQKSLGHLKVKIFDNQGKMRSMIVILKELAEATKNLSDEKKLSVVKDIFGTQAAAGALQIFKGFQTGTVEEILKKVKEANGTAKAMADTMQSTTMGAFWQFESGVESIGIAIGSVLLPPIATVTNKIADFATVISTVVAKFPTLTKFIGITIASLAALKIGLIVTGYTFTFFKGAVLSTIWPITALAKRTAIFGTVLTFLSTSLMPVIARISALGLALLANPITWIIGGIALGAVLLVKYWTPIGEFFKNLFSGIIGWIEKAYAWVCKFLAPLKIVAETATNLTGKAWNFLSEEGSGRIGAVGSSIGKSLRNFATGVFDGLGNTFGDLDENKTNSEIPKPSFYWPGNSQSNSQITITAPITINNSGGSNLDDRKIADQVKAALDETFRKLTARRYALNYDQF